MNPRGLTPLGPADYAVVYYAEQGTAAWWTRLIDRRFVHCEVWWELGDGYWVALRPNHCHLTFDVMVGPPETMAHCSAVQRVRVARQKTSPMCPVGAKTCVSLVKATLGVRVPWIVTPRQLYNYLNKRLGAT